MKNLFLIGGTMGIGKSTVSRCLKHRLPNGVFLDGDWCWDAEPFVVTEETKKMVMDKKRRFRGFGGKHRFCVDYSAFSGACFLARWC